MALMTELGPEMTEKTDALLAWLRRRENEMAILLAELVAIPTENPPGRNYGACVDLLEKRLRGFGRDCERVEALPRKEDCGEARASLLAGFGHGERTLYFHGHYDVVPAQSAEQFQQFLATSFAHYRALMKPGASLYVSHSSSWQREFQSALEAAGFDIRCQIIWAKNTFAWGFGRYKFQHEPLFYCHVEGQKDAWYGDKSQSTLWAEKKPAANRIHPTAKPVELIERALINSSKAGDVVVDLFGGSGSTLIGCERRGRKSRLMEIDPKYADCIVQRYQEYTGKQAVMEGDGRTFDAIAQERVKEAA
jgi:hypothetical protein